MLWGLGSKGILEGMAPMQCVTFIAHSVLHLSGHAPLTKAMLNPQACLPSLTGTRFEGRPSLGQFAHSLGGFLCLFPEEGVKAGGNSGSTRGTNIHFKTMPRNSGEQAKRIGCTGGGDLVSGRIYPAARGQKVCPVPQQTDDPGNAFWPTFVIGAQSPAQSLCSHVHWGAVGVTYSCPQCTVELIS